MTPKNFEKKLFVTVGTTKFPKLINIFTTKAFVDTLFHSGYYNIQLQTGRDFVKPNIDPELTDVKITKEDKCVVVMINSKLTLRYNAYFEDFGAQILKADLVISHAGAGTCLDVLRRKKKLIVVVNEDLMDNHQIELAETLQNKGYLYYCTCDQLVNTFSKNFAELKEYPTPDKNLFSSYLDKCMGFAD